jgi:FixJ family two-component response regulator
MAARVRGIAPSLLPDGAVAEARPVPPASRIRQAFPEVPVLFVSGYSDRRVDLPAYGDAAAFLGKPFTAQALTGRVRTLPDGSQRVARGA